MFGYLKIDKEELRIKNFRQYKAIYCGICNALRKEYGFLYTVLLNYEVVFLYIFLDAISVNSNKEYMNLKCPVNPFYRKKKLYSVDILDFVAFINMHLTVVKCRDDYEDEHKIYKKILEWLIVHNRKYKKIFLQYLSLAIDINDCYVELERMEKNVELCSIDEYLKPMGKLLQVIILAYIDRYISDLDRKQREYISELGNHLGRWVYLVDAFDDYSIDVKKKRFNLLTVPNSNIDGNILQNAYSMLLLSNYVMNVIVSKIDLKQNEELVMNYFEYGLNEKLREILSRREYKLY